MDLERIEQTDTEVMDLDEERKHFFRTDPHCHILPGIDDGSRSLEMSLKMAERAASFGIRTMVATPHACHPANNCGLSANGYRERVSQLNDHLRSHDVPIVVYPGMEYLLNDKIPELFESGELLSWADQGRYVLIELGFHECKDCIWPVLDYFDARGITPIIAHPERYTWLPDNLDVLHELIERGYYMQLNVMSINGLWGVAQQNMALKLLHMAPRWVVGTDSHSDADKFWGIDQVRRTLIQEKVLPARHSGQ